jgi:hypothetical protein
MKDIATAMSSTMIFGSRWNKPVLQPLVYHLMEGW